MKFNFIVALTLIGEQTKKKKRTVILPKKVVVSWRILVSIPNVTGDRIKREFGEIPKLFPQL